MKILINRTVPYQNLAPLLKPGEKPTEAQLQAIREATMAAIDRYRSQGFTHPQAAGQTTVDQLMLNEGMALRDLNDPKARKPFEEELMEALKQFLDQKQARNIIVRPEEARTILGPECVAQLLEEMRNLTIGHLLDATTAEVIRNHREHQVPKLVARLNSVFEGMNVTVIVAAMMQMIAGVEIERLCRKVVAVEIERLCRNAIDDQEGTIQ